MSCASECACGSSGNSRSSVQQCAGQTHLLVAGGNSRPSGFTRAERHEVGVQLELEAVQRRQWSIFQSQIRKQWRVGARKAMRRDVNDARSRCVLKNLL